MNALDKFIGWFDPGRAAERVRARLLIDKMRKYDGAALGRRVNSWTAQGSSANTEIATSLPLLRDRHRELVRNNPWASRAVQAVVSNTVGYGFTAKVADERAAKVWKEWAETTACDSEGRHTLAGLSALAMRAVAESGEVLIRRRWRRPTDGLPVPLQLQVIESDYLDHSKTEMLDNGRIVQGVEFDLLGKRRGYWLYKDHPGDVMGNYSQSVFVPASEVLHVYRADRPGQVRGVPWGAAAMITLRDLDDYEDAYLFRQKIANCQVGVVYDDAANLGNVEAAAAGAPLAEAFEPGRFEFLPAGKRIEFNSPPNAGDYGPFTKAVLLRYAAAWGITFQALTGDLSSVNFSSGRMGWIEMGRNVESWRWNMLVPQALDPIGQWFREAINFGREPAKFGISWTAPRKEMINPAQEIKSFNEAVRSGQMSLAMVHREMGEDHDAILQETAETNAKLDALGVVLDSDPRQDKRAATPKPPEGDDDAAET